MFQTKSKLKPERIVGAPFVLMFLAAMTVFALMEKPKLRGSYKHVAPAERETPHVEVNARLVFSTLLSLQWSVGIL